MCGLWVQQAYSACPACCAGMGGVQYCDSSVGRYVCSNGYYSDCYCTRHAVMDLQRVHGCCLWQGGVMVVNELGLVICNSGSVSEVCSLQVPVESVSIW
ncbi:MAG: neurogenic locus notch [Legionellales bacterium]|nr:neurogenic locus notch [Legionellales bacterium]